jgi:phosphoribosylformimino-5-aminoimidazole carboxamide ribotide isomerase
MEIIPVIDLMGGAVVRAHMGRRDQYRPIVTPLSPTSDPVDVTRGLLAVHPFAALYIADIDAIEGRGGNRQVVRRLQGEFPDLALWVDSGIADLDGAADWLSAGLGHLVIGSETQSDAGLVRGLSGDKRVALSLDFDDAAFRGPAALLAEPRSWPRKVIVMTLARVGSNGGPDFARLAQIRKDAGNCQLYAAGGVRNLDDLVRLGRAGMAGALVASSLHDGRLSGGEISALAVRRPEP